MPKITKHPGVSLFQLADGRHVARWRDPLSKKSHQQSLSGLGLSSKPQREAWAKAKSKELLSVKAAVTSGRALEERQSVASAASRFLARSEIAERTRQTQRPVVERVFVGFMQQEGVRDMHDIRPLHLQRFADYVRDELGFLPGTADRYNAIVAKFIRWAGDRGMCVDLHDGDVKQRLRRVGAEPEVRTLRPKEAQDLLEACIDHDADEHARDGREPASSLVLLALLTGMRSEELRGLRWAEIDLGEGEIRLPKERTKGGSARGKSRDIGLSICPTAWELLRAMRRRSLGCGFLFPSPSEESRDGFLSRSSTSDMTRRLVKRYKAPEGFTLKACRKTCGTVLANAKNIFGDASVFQAAKRLGHTVQVAERHYWNVMKVPEAATTIEAALGIEDVARRIVAMVSGDGVKSVIVKEAV